MCDFRIIIKAPTGYVAQCSFCRSLEIAFRTSIVHIDFHHWYGFNNYIARARRSYGVPVDRDLKGIMLHFGGDGPLQMFLSANELKELYDLTERADNEIKAQNLFALFNN